jgi:hypothetical protein
MGTASRSTAAPATMPHSLRAALHWLPAAATVVGVAALLRLVYHPWFLNYDARYALVWARDIATGLTPDYTGPYAPTPHPLETAVSLVAVPFGAGGDAIMVWLVLLCFGVLVWLAYRLGAELFSPAVGVVAALVVLTRPALERDALLGYQDTPFAVLILWAVLLEARRPKRGAPVLVLLAVAGLMRPEAWALAGLYALYVWRGASTRERVLYAGLTALAPLLWALGDWLVTGDALHSLHGTAALAETVDRRRDPLTGPYWTAKYLGYTLREPLVAGIPIGLVFAFRQRLRGAVLPLVVAAAMLAVFLASPLFGLPLIGRYVRTPAVLLALFYGLAVFGWRMLPAGRERRRWAVVGVLAAALSVAFLPWHVGMLSSLNDRLDYQGAYYRDLREVGRAPAVRAAVEACGRVATADHRPIPHLRWWLDGDPGSVAPVTAGSARGARILLLPRRTRLMRRFYGPVFPTAGRRPGTALVYRNASWRVFAAPACVKRA